MDEVCRWKVLKLVDWLLDLPVELNGIYWDEVRDWKEGKTMPFVAGLERIVREEGQREGERVGLLEGLELSLELKFGEAGRSFFSELEAVEDASKLRDVTRALRKADGIVDLRKIL